LSRLHDAQENYRETCRKLDVKRLSTAAASAAGVDINVLQCDENISFTDSITDVNAPPSQQTVCFKPICDDDDNFFSNKSDCLQFHSDVQFSESEAGMLVIGLEVKFVAWP